MAVTKSRASMTRDRQLKLGRKFAQFKVDNHDRRFTIHEDLICRNSKYFRRYLQGGRKDVNKECVVCQEVTDPSVSDIAFCRDGCGDNFHEHCLENESGIFRKCPTCDKAFLDDPLSVNVNADLDRVAIDRYIQWLYSLKSLKITDDLPNDLSTPRVLILHTLELLRLHSVGVIFEDKTFIAAVLKSLGSVYCKKPKHAITEDTVLDVYRDDYIIEKSRKVLANLFVMDMPIDWFSNFSAVFPPSFVRDLGDACVRRMAEKSAEDLLREYLDAV